MPMVGERWLPVAGYELYYHASNYGRVKSLARVIDRGGVMQPLRERILKPGVHRSGHLYVNLFRDGVQDRRFVHHLVLEAFVGPCPDGMEGCHFPDRDPANNHVNNLRWDTRQANRDDMVHHGTTNQGERHGLSKLTENDVREIRIRLSRGEVQKEIAAVYGVCQKSISYINTGRAWTHVE